MDSKFLPKLISIKLNLPIKSPLNTNPSSNTDNNSKFIENEDSFTWSSTCIQIGEYLITSGILFRPIIDLTKEQIISEGLIDLKLKELPLDINFSLSEFNHSKLVSFDPSNVWVQYLPSVYESITSTLLNNQPLNQWKFGNLLLDDNENIINSSNLDLNLRDFNETLKELELDLIWCSSIILIKLNSSNSASLLEAPNLNIGSSKLTISGFPFGENYANLIPEYRFSTELTCKLSDNLFLLGSPIYPGMEGCPGYLDGKLAGICLPTIRHFKDNQRIYQLFLPLKSINSPQLASLLNINPIKEVSGIKSKLIQCQNNAVAIWLPKLSQYSTGILIANTSYIITNRHTIEPLINSSSKQIKIRLNSKWYSKVKIVWINEYGWDLSILRIDDDDFNSKEFYQWGLNDIEDVDWFKTAVDKTVYSIGYAGLSPQQTPYPLIHQGQVNSIHNHPQFGPIMLITDAKVINGNSGGPMINSEGKLVGVITSNARTNNGMEPKLNFSIPSPVILKLVKKLLNNDLQSTNVLEWDSRCQSVWSLSPINLEHDEDKFIKSKL
ncbi:trypsin-like serine protease [Conidiobolus coronatus NRRL 28638]|uniref:Trypsin-like serine protease n=1 Tax=Conidiobolus coronatus (strain ATCC 28846 / CBS 209.66 / NRRL 28638) TaxID=796925 RepID=A0A137PCY5_CONC2|nr:trypsin-like serine protease [Conidiobolus coronatus NRRL 28638]|eukprot:KXN72850.1 trypsin-like serine protease [Conidiobolus coronatus NRRL 28638]